MSSRPQRSTKGKAHKCAFCDCGEPQVPRQVAQMTRSPRQVTQKKRSPRQVTQKTRSQKQVAQMRSVESDLNHNYFYFSFNEPSYNNTRAPLRAETFTYMFHQLQHCEVRLKDIFNTPNNTIDFSSFMEATVRGNDRKKESKTRKIGQSRKIAEVPRPVARMSRPKENSSNQNCFRHYSSNEKSGPSGIGNNIMKRPPRAATFTYGAYELKHCEVRLNYMEPPDTEFSLLPNKSGKDMAKGKFCTSRRSQSKF